MATESSVPSERRGDKQALKEDYRNSNYDKGHLVPVFHQNSQSCVDATFTLTNAAPQFPSLNRGQWKAKERDVAKKLTANCLNRGFQAYIVTGVVPGNTYINNKVNVPWYFWSAYCCVDNNNRPQLSGAYFALNYINQVNEISIADLDAALGRDYSTSGFQVFSGQCKPVPPTQGTLFDILHQLYLRQQLGIIMGETLSEGL